MASKPIPPGDEDLAALSVEALLGEVVSLSAYLTHAEAWRLRRVRAFRLLRERDYPRNEIARLAGVTSPAIKNLIDDLDRGEHAWEDARDAEAAAKSDDPPCDRCEDPFSWHHGHRDHPKQVDKGCVPPAEAGRTCFCTEFETPQESTT